MKAFNILIILFFSSFILKAQSLTVENLTCEHKEDPVGIDVQNPRLSWKIVSSKRNILQTAYQIRVSTDKTFTKSKLVWNTGKVISDESVLQKYYGDQLISGQKYYWQVKIWDNNKRESRWSSSAYWETGLLNQSEWKAQWIELKGDTNRQSPSPYLRKEFSVSKEIERAVAYVTAHGLYELHLNGKKVGDQVFTPGWTTYNQRIQYQTYDVTDQLMNGKNAIGAVLGEGWYKGTMGWQGKWGVYGKKLGLLMQLVINYSDGTSSIIVTDDTWKGTQNGPILKNGIYFGEEYDATKRLVGWDKAGYNEENWQNVVIGEYINNLVSAESVEIKKIEEITPIKIFRSPKGALLVDMGQNMVGWIRLKVSGTKGTQITIRHAEVLDKYGEFYTENLRSAESVLKYTLAGMDEEIYEPRFTFMGFRYLEIQGFPGKLTEDNITGIVAHSNMNRTGEYKSSDSLLNQLQQNIVWGQKGNFLDVPTDCPQRDERLGWTGDAQIFFRTAAFNFDVAAFFTKWLKDLALEQREGGEVPIVIPDVLSPQSMSTGWGGVETSAGWGDAAVIIPWTMYMVYGDRDILEKQYPSMKAWVEYIRSKAGESMIWTGGSIYGDWLFYHPFVNNHSEPDGHTDHDLIATAFYAYSASLLAEAARVLKKNEDSRLYHNLFNQIKKVFNHEYITPAGRIGTNSQTSYVLALMFNLVPEDMREKSAKFLVDDIKMRGNHLSTGFLGTPYLCHVLSDNGYTDVAYDLLLQTPYPSWLYPVTMGATTIWERWDGQKPDSTFQDSNMNSFNHYAYGAIGDWMYRVSAGLETKSAGYRHLLIQPHPTKLLTRSQASFESSYGHTQSGWERKDGKIFVKVVIPANATASIVLPTQHSTLIMIEGKSIDENENIRNIENKDNKVIFNVGSGNYVFEYPEKYTTVP